ncbi:MAG: transposase [Saprospiraceae bacterium]|nr:transposase [Saprospiraceae bacterium]
MARCKVRYARCPAYLGANMSSHPHLHTIVPAGGWDDINQKWVPAKKLKNGFFIPQKVAAACFKKHFLTAFSQIWEEGNLLLPKELMHLNTTEGFNEFYKKIAFKKNWVVKIMPPLDNPQRVVDYLGRYIFRIAITDSRIKEVKIKEQTVTIDYKDYAAQKDPNKPTPVKALTLNALEFIRRFSQHVLPKGFQKVRYSGIYATAVRKKLRLKIIEKAFANITWQKNIRTVCQIVATMIGQNPNACSCCGAENLIVIITKPVNPPKQQPKIKNQIVCARPPPDTMTI